MVWNQAQTGNTAKIALILSGGGARAAYQVGVLQAVADLIPKGTTNPFPIICGTSAGAINAASLAIYSSSFREAVWRLVHVWGNFHVNQVFQTSMPHLTKSALHWLMALTLGGLGKRNPVSLLDRAPLVELLNHYLPFENIQKSIDKGYIDAVSITASGYYSGRSVAFFQGRENIESWERSHHIGLSTKLDLRHLMASSAIPFVFSAEQIGDDYYGDGTVRQTAPISPALHLGADKLFVIGVKNENGENEKPPAHLPYPSLGQIGGHVLDSIFLDNIGMDLERLKRINKTISQFPEKRITIEGRNMRVVDVFTINPSQDLYDIAQKHANKLPRSVRFFLRGIGASAERGSNLVSYILFEKAFCRELISLGFNDTMRRRDELLDFIYPKSTTSNPAFAAPSAATKR